MLARSQRSVNHVMVLPNYNLSAQLEGMQRAKERFGVGAWKCYTPWGPQNNAVSTPGGFWLDDEATGIPFIERGRRGVKGSAATRAGRCRLHPTTRRRARRYRGQTFPDCHSSLHSAYQQGGTASGAYVEWVTCINSLIPALKSAGSDRPERVVEPERLRDVMGTPR